MKGLAARSGASLFSQLARPEDDGLDLRQADAFLARAARGLSQINAHEGVLARNTRARIGRAPGYFAMRMASLRNHLEPATVLVIDDDAAVRDSLKFSLQLDGFAVRLYADGSAILSEPDLPRRGCLVVDHHLPRLSGLDVIVALRARHVRLPAILLATYPDTKTCARAAAAGVALIEQPVLDDGLTRAIRAAMADAR